MEANDRYFDRGAVYFLLNQIFLEMSVSWVKVCWPLERSAEE